MDREQNFNIDDEPLESLKEKLSNLQRQNQYKDNLLAETQQRAAMQEVSSNKVVLENAYDAEALKAEMARKRYAEAQQFKQYEEAAEAQRQLTESSLKMDQYAQAYKGLNNQNQDLSYNVSPERQFEQIMQQVDPNTRQWAYNHKQNLMSPDKAQLAMSAAQFAYTKGYTPGSDDFIQFMDEQLGYKSNKQERSQEQVKNNNNYVNYSAPSSRASSNGNKRVYLDEDDLKLASSFNMSPEQWAKNKAQTEKIFKGNGWDRPGINQFTVVSE